jgi:hypothetical protein
MYLYAHLYKLIHTLLCIHKPRQTHSHTHTHTHTHNQARRDCTAQLIGHVNSMLTVFQADPTRLAYLVQVWM